MSTDWPIPYIPGYTPGQPGDRRQWTTATYTPFQQPIGRCSKCNGPVVCDPLSADPSKQCQSMGRCTKCGATEDDLAHLPVIPMK